MIVEIPYTWFWFDRFNGLTLFALILVKDKTNTRVVNHEKKHVEQWRRNKFTFHIRYLYYLFKYGYYDNPYEIDARKI